MKDTYNGYPVLKRGPIPANGSAEHNLIVKAISEWKAARFVAPNDFKTCENAARELQIELETGIVVAINTRC